MGDFNEIIHVHERKNQKTMDKSTEDIIEWNNENYLWDIPI